MATQTARSRSKVLSTQYVYYFTYFYRSTSSLRTRGHNITFPHTDFNLYKILLLTVVSSIFFNAPISPSHQPKPRVLAARGIARNLFWGIRFFFWGGEGGIKLLNSRSDVIFTPIKITWADFGGINTDITPVVTPPLVLVTDVPLHVGYNVFNFTVCLLCFVLYFCTRN